jgi:putrescine---pyruvate transaminase
VTGFGRTGAMFGSRGWGVKPDIMSLAKGINSGYVPLGATVVSEKIARAWDKQHPAAGIFHGYTYSGHPLACAAALANLKIVQDEKLPENAGAVGAYFMDKLAKLMDHHEVIGDVRGKGLMIGIELVKNRKTKEPFAPADPIHRKLTHGARARGAVIRVNAGKIIISPPLTFTKAHADTAVAMFDDLMAEAVKS